MMAKETWTQGGFLAEVQLRQYRVFDHGTLDTLPSVCNEIGCYYTLLLTLLLVYSTPVLVL